ncbi:hypothetical protein BKA70DRAFT_1426781 [Coprinopsis sp. MPI-PUGE-AT-0042]|nr:hypothetical protein BKA70DRAFT_1426781 [Coprinopsis sp. MPI-PUGE-AT-0042]
MPGPDLHVYARSNEPLPYHLRTSLKTFIDHIEDRQDVCKRDQRRIRQAVEDRRSMIEALENEVERLEIVEEGLERTLDELEKKKVQYASTLSPIRRIPPEVVATIIHDGTMNASGCFGEEERLNFSRIRSTCGLWRQTAYSTPALWRGLAVDLDRLLDNHSAEETFAIVRRRLSSWFSHAGKGAPIKLFLTGATSSFASSILDFISEAGLNVTSLAFQSNPTTPGLSFGDATAFGIFIRHPPRTLPVAELHVTLARGGTRLQTPLQLGFDLPHLTSLTLSIENHHFDHLLVSLQHNNLSSLHLRNV